MPVLSHILQVVSRIAYFVSDLAGLGQMLIDLARVARDLHQKWPSLAQFGLFERNAVMAGPVQPCVVRNDSSLSIGRRFSFLDCFDY